MKKRLISLITLCTLFFNFFACCFSFADSPTDIIYNILNNDNGSSSKTGVDVIDTILSNDDSTQSIIKINKKDKKTNIKIIKKESAKDVNEDSIKKEVEKVSNNHKNKNAYLLGLDISKHNGIVNWKEIKKAGIKVVIFRAGYGPRANSDIYFKQNIEGAIKAGMLIGIYWFSYAYTNNMAINEAKQCIKTIEPYRDKITLGVYYDFEYDSTSYASKNGVTVGMNRASSMADAFCSTIQDNGYKAGIYTNIDYANNYFSKSVMSKYLVWIAQWTKNCTYHNSYVMWQRSDSFNISGEKFDLDYFYFNRFFK